MNTYTPFPRRTLNVTAVTRDGTVVVEVYDPGRGGYLEAVPRDGSYLRVRWRVLRAMLGVGPVLLRNLPSDPTDTPPPRARRGHAPG